MLRNIFRAIFVIIIAGVLLTTASSTLITKTENSTSFWSIVLCGFGLAIFVFLIDILTPKKKLTALAGVFFGLLVGLLISVVLAPAVDMVIEVYKLHIIPEAALSIKWMLGICICYLTISVIMRTKDDVRFVVPYVEFTKQTKGARPLILDTSAIIDGRIADLYQGKLFDAPLIVPRFVLNELQMIADSPDKLKRNRGRRGLDILKRMQDSTTIDIEIDDATLPEIEEAKGVDEKIVVFVKNRDGRLVTTDFNLTKVAHVREVDVMNINNLANSLKSIALPGETMEVRIIKPGEEAEQGIGYLDDGTMVVVEGARNKIGRDIVLSITSSLQTSAGKMIFGKFEEFAQKSEDNKKQSSYSQRNQTNTPVS